MREYEQNEAKSDESQDDLVQISRRGFIRLATLGGVASAGMFAIGNAQAQSPHVRVSAAYLRQLRFEAHRCRNTRNVFLNNTINEVFKSRSFGDLLREGKERTKIKKVSGLPDRIQNVIRYISDEDPPLREYFMDPLLTSDDPPLAAALDAARLDFSVPFINDGFRWDVAEELLDDENGAPFLARFGNHYLGRFARKSRGKIGTTDEEILARAHCAGFFRTMSEDEAKRMFGAGSDQCAKEINGNWTCVTSDGDKCEIVDGYPTASTNLCP